MLPTRKGTANFIFASCLGLWGRKGIGRRDAEAQTVSDWLALIPAGCKSGKVEPGIGNFESVTKDDIMVIIETSGNRKPRH
jgi:hypothetical protein